MSKLQRLRASGFLSIRDVDIEIRNLNVLIGANGSGKSNFVGLFRLLNNLVEERLQVFVATRGGANSILHFGRKVSSSLSIELEFGPNGYSCRLVPAADDTLIFEAERWSFQGFGYPRPFIEGNGSGQRESGLQAAVTRSKIADFVYKAMKSWKVFHFHDTSDSAAIKQLGPIDDNASLRPDASNLAAFLFRLKTTQPVIYRNILDTVRSAAPFIKDFELRQSPTSSGKIKLEWTHENSEAYFDANSLSDGSLRFICLATLLLQPELPSVVLLDEPELGLHPAAISDLASLLRRASTRTQVVVSTQSVTLINHLEPADIIVTEQVNGASSFRRFNIEEIASWLDQYALGELWEKNIFGGRP